MRSTAAPSDWWLLYNRIARHHSRPFEELSRVFCCPSHKGSMPQKWSCTCGTHVPISMTYCGTCGRRWDKVGKQVPNGSNKGRKEAKPPKATAPAVGQHDASAVEFVIPNIGVQPVQQSPQPFLQPSHMPILPSFQSTNAPRQEVPVKSLKTLLHQRANRIGKVEARMDKLKAALTTIQQDWPRYVHGMYQQIQQKHRECLDFQKAVEAELTQLRTEHHGLLTQKLEDPITIPSVQPAPMPQDRMMQATQVLDFVLPTACTQQSTYAQVPAAMEVDPGTHRAETSLNTVSHMGMPPMYPVRTHTVPPAPVACTEPAPVQMPAPHTNVGLPNTQGQVQPSQCQMPPGDWNWPPTQPGLCFQSKNRDRSYQT